MAKDKEDTEAGEEEGGGGSEGGEALHTIATINLIRPFRLKRHGLTNAICVCLGKEEEEFAKGELAGLAPRTTAKRREIPWL